MSKTIFKVKKMFCFHENFSILVSEVNFNDFDHNFKSSYVSKLLFRFFVKKMNYFVWSALLKISKFFFLHMKITILSIKDITYGQK